MRIQPTIDDIITAALIGIASHPHIVNPDVYYPQVDPNAPPQIVRITEFRDFGGLNLDGPDDGITCSVYPYYSDRNPRSGSPRRLSSAATARFEPQVLGDRRDQYSYDRVTYLLIVELAMKDSGLGLPLELTYAVADSPFLQIANHAYGYTVTDPSASSTPQPPVSWQIQTVNIRTNPAERVLRQYIDRMRFVLADLPTLQPFNVRYTQVIGYDLYTSNWLQHSTNVYFHSANLLWEVTLYVHNAAVRGT